MINIIIWIRDTRYYSVEELRDEDHDEEDEDGDGGEELDEAAALGSTDDGDELDEGCEQAGGMVMARSNDEIRNGVGSCWKVPPVHPRGPECETGANLRIGTGRLKNLTWGQPKQKNDALSSKSF
jgi:hypothetical protein